MSVIFDIFVHVYILVIYVIYLGTGWAHSRRVRIKRRKEYDSRFIYRVVSEIFSRSCFGLNSIGQRCLHYVNVYATNRCSLYINFHEILSRWTIMHNSKE